jgi:hypothetical protein
MHMDASIYILLNFGEKYHDTASDIGNSKYETGGRLSI